MRLPVLLLLLAGLCTPAFAEAAKQPNFLIIVADDLGFSDIGAFGGEIATPNLDAIATGGIRLTGFHTAPTCSPTRSMLLSGTDNHRAGLGTMAELIAPNQLGKPGHEGYLRPDVATLAERLAAGGYRTLFSGKWHLGLTPEQDPSARGFQQSFVLLQGAHNHFGTGLSVDPKKGATYRENGKTLSNLPGNFYSTDTFTDKLIDQLKASDRAKPFFAYLAFTAPHWPLHAHDGDIAKYRGRYDAGFEVLRAERLSRQKQLGLIAPGVVPHSLKHPKGGWDSLTADEKKQAARDMEVYAAMVDRIDQNIGRLIRQLKESGEYDDTVILFLADNGAEALDLETTSLKSVKTLTAAADNKLDNRGKTSSYIAYGPGWAQAATAPSWLNKAYATEGGTRVVSFISWRGFARQRSIASPFLSVSDVAPTFLDIAGIAYDQQSFAGRNVQPITGKSWLPYLQRQADRVYGAEESHGTELFGSRAIRRGDWKITDIGDGKWRLFNLAEDPGETRDLSLEFAERRKELIAAWEEYAKNVGVVLPDEAVYRP
jgi:arylsulfatase A-like enzyme